MQRALRKGWLRGLVHTANTAPGQGRDGGGQLRARGPSGYIVAVTAVIAGAYLY